MAQGSLAKREWWAKARASAAVGTKGPAGTFRCRVRAPGGLEVGRRGGLRLCGDGEQLHHHRPGSTGVYIKGRGIADGEPTALEKTEFAIVGALDHTTFADRAFQVFRRRSNTPSTQCPDR